MQKFIIIQLINQNDKIIFKEVAINLKILIIKDKEKNKKCKEFHFFQFRWTVET